MTSKKHRAIAFFAGTIICILAIECALRIVGAIYAHRSVTDQGTRNPSQYTILCVGDSVTFGIGAPRNHSYPAQLERLLNAKESKRTYTVINRGRPGQNTAQLLETLEDNIRAVEPDIVLILTGSANQSNYYGYRAHRERTRKEGGSFLSFVHDQFYRIRLYKLVKLLCWNIQNKNEQGIRNEQPQPQRVDPYEEMSFHEMDLPNGLITDPYNSKNYCITGREYMDKGDYDAALRWFFSGIRANASDPELYSSIGDLFRERGQYDVARRWYQKGISIDSTFSQNYEGMGWLYIGKRQYKQALPWFKKALQVPQPHTLSPFRYEGIAHAFRDLGLYSEAMDFFTKEKRRNPLAKDYLLMFKKRRIQKEVKQWIQQDIGRIISLCGRYNVRIILQNYPKEYLIDDVLRKVGNRHGIPFVDHNRVFSRILKEGASREQYFAPDGHPNAQGYGVMATNIYNTLQESNVLKFLKNP